MRRTFGRFLGWLATVSLMAGGLSARGQSTQADISARLRGKSLFLRGFWAEDKLKFDVAGQPEKAYRILSFTVAGFEFSKANLKGDQLHIEGKRSGLEFDKNGGMRRVKLDERITIDVDGHGTSDFTKALDAIFTDGLREIAPTLPSFWQPFATHLVDPSSAKPLSPIDLATAAKKAHSDSKSEAVHIGGSVKPPKVLTTDEPQYSEAARRMKLSGDVQVYLWVEENGVPSHVRIIQPLGLNLDENAVASVLRYKFQPAMQNGKPVKVDLYINVNFQIF